MMLRFGVLTSCHRLVSGSGRRRRRQELGRYASSLVAACLAVACLPSDPRALSHAYIYKQQTS